MEIYLLVYVFNILLIYVVCGDNATNSTILKLDSVNKTLNASKPKLEKFTLASEGGSLLASDHDLALSKENLTSLMDLDAEMGKTKEKSYVKPRKGVDNLLLDNNTVPKNVSLPTSANSSFETFMKENNIKQNTTDTTAHATNNTKPVQNQTTPSKNQTTVIPKKPLILSYESLATADKNIKVSVKPSPKSLDNNQIPSPNENSFVKIYPSKVNSHPGMIMPIVITILVVPMFAIVGYMALKRGKEAWKNRHYKRMDFLLDGMYNE